jgi:type IV pilus assembly protein PilE
MPRTKHQGLTLIELLVTIVILGVLVSIAVPGYRQYIVRGKRSAAQSVMLDIANREQQFFLANRAYADRATLEANGYQVPPEVSESYTWTATVGGPVPSFVITFTGTGTQAGDNLPGPLTLTSEGLKTPVDKWKQ